ncbi:MAG: hypothetical protein M3036_05205 [Bifidobacteriales bacterium]|nr:hypothetical protein [Bifidobacteriales bacterium]
MTPPLLEETAIIFGADGNDLWPTLCAIQSVITHNPHTQLDFYILHTTIPTTLQHLITALFQTESSQLTFLDVAQKAQALRTHTHPRWQASCFYRCYLPVLFREKRFILWLDNALLVTGSLAPLLHRFPQEASLGAVVDPLAYMLQRNNVPLHTLLGDAPAAGLPDTTLAHYTKDHLSLTQPEHYFNSNMLLLRPRLISPSQINRCFTLATRPYLCPGTDILNQVFHNHVHLLPERWNFMTGKLTENLCLHLPESWKKQRETERLHRCILNFPEGAKPWQDPALPGASHYQRLSTQLEDRLSRLAPTLIRTLCSG